MSIVPAENPFYLEISGSYIEYESHRNIHDCYSGIYVLCLNENAIKAGQHIKTKTIMAFGSKNTTIDELLSYSSLLKFIPANFNILKVNGITRKLVPISRSIMEKFVPDLESVDGNSDDEFLVLPFLSIDFSYTCNWLERTCTPNDELIMDMNLRKLHGINIDLLPLIKKHIPIDEWDSSKTRYNFMISVFNTRKTGTLNYNPAGVETPAFYDFSADLSATAMPEQVEFSTYSPATIDRITEIFALVDSEFHMYHVACRLLLSRKFCHHVTGNKDVLGLLEPIFKKYSPFVNYCLGYAWMQLYSEELISKKIDLADRFVFDLETATNLPVVSTNFEDIDYNPYFVRLVSDTYAKNQWTKPVVGPSFENRGICDLKQFKMNIALFMTGDMKKFGFMDNVDWTNKGLTGSIMPATLPRNRLLSQNSHKSPCADSLCTLQLSLMSEYSSSDVDICCEYDRTIDFIDSMGKFANQVSCGSGGDPSKNKYIAQKKVSIYVNSGIMMDKCASENVGFTFGQFEQHNNDDKNIKVLQYIGELYKKSHSKYAGNNLGLISDHINDPGFMDILDPSGINSMNITKTRSIKILDPAKNGDIISTYYMLSDGTVTTHPNETDDIFIRFTDIIKFELDINGLFRKIDYFNVRGTILNTVARFHFPCVRAYYDGTTCHILASAISAYMTHMNCDARYHKSTTVFLDIVCKYMRRGFGNILNDSELAVYRELEFAKGINRAKYDRYMPVAMKKNGPAHTILSLYPRVDNKGKINAPRKWIIDAGYDIIKK